MKTFIGCTALASALAFACPLISAHAATLTYHGTLQDAGKPANGAYDIQLSLYSAATGGSSLGAPVTLYAVPVKDGHFSTDVDFGASAQSDGASWVATSVRPAGSGDFVALSARTSASPAATSTCNGTWALDGNAGNPSGSYLGTADNQPLLLKSNGSTVATFTGGSQTADSVALGHGTSATGYADFAAGDASVAAGAASTALGAKTVASGHTSFAAGDGAVASHPGSFVWADDSVDGGFSDTGSQQFLIRATGGVGIGTNNPSGLDLYVSGKKGVKVYDIGSGDALESVQFSTQGAAPGSAAVHGVTVSANAYGVMAENISPGGTALYVNAPSASGTTHVISTSTGAYLSAGGQWAPNSDRNKKFGIASLDMGSILEKVLAMPVTSWSYKVEGDSIHHVGPMAQDFYAAFRLGEDDKHIGTVDEGGVALAAIQGLNKKLETDNASLHTELAELRSRVDAMLAAKGE